MNVAREVSGVVCSRVNFTYPYLPPQAPTTCIKTAKLIHVSSTYTGACIIHRICPVDKSPGLLSDHCYMFTKCMLLKAPLDCCFGRSLPGKCMLPRKPNRYITDSPWCNSTRVLVQSACQARKVLYVYRCLNHIYIQVTTLVFLGLCLGGKSLLMPFLCLIHPSSRKESELTHQDSKHYSPATTLNIKIFPKLVPTSIIVRLPLTDRTLVHLPTTPQS